MEILKSASQGSHFLMLGFSLFSMYMHRNIYIHTAQNKDNKLDKANINIKLLCTDINIYKKA